MRAEFVNPFVQGAYHVIGMVVGITPERGQLSARPSVFTTQQVNLVFGMTGQVQGQIIYGMSIQTAQKVASKMLGMPVPSFDQLAASAIAELGNMISGTSMTNMSQLGLVCDITPPTIIRGSNVRITTLDVPAIVVPLRLGDTGTIEMNVSLQERAANKAA